MPRSKEEILADIRARIYQLNYRPTMVDTMDTPQYRTGSTLVPTVVPKVRPATLRQGEYEQIDSGEYRQGVDVLDKVLATASGAVKGALLLPEPSEEEKELAKEGTLSDIIPRTPYTVPPELYEAYVKGRSVESGWGTVGEIGGAAIPLSKAFKAVGTVKTGVQKAVAVVFPKAAETIGKMARGAVVGAGYGAGKEAVKAGLTDEKFDPKEVGKESAMFATGEGALSVLGKGFKFVKDAFTRSKYKLKSEAGQEAVTNFKNEQEIVGTTKGELQKLVPLKELQKIKKADREAISDQLRAGGELTGVAKRLADSFGKIHQMMQESGADVGYRANYFSQILKDSKQVWRDLRPLAEKISDGDVPDAEVMDYIATKTSPETQKVFAYLRRTGQMTDYQTNEAVIKLAGHANPDAFGVIIPKSRFTKSRPFNFEMDKTLLENDPLVVGEMYVSGASKLIARNKQWGVKGEKFDDILKRAPADERDLIKTMMDAQSGVRFVKEGFKNPAVQDFFDAYINFGSAAKIGLGTSTVPNLVQTLGVSMARSGAWNSVLGSAKLFSESVRNKVRQSGAMGVYDPFAVATETSGEAAFAKTARVATTPFRLANEMDAMLAGAQGREAIQSWHALANKAGNGFRQLNARHQLRELGINYKEELTEELLQRKTYRFTVETQLYKDITNEPIWMSDPKLAPLLFLKKYGLKQAYAVKDILMKDVMVRDEMGKLVAINPLPALRLAAGGVVGGEGVRWANEKIRELTTGKANLTEGDISRIDRIIEDVAAMGAYGILSDALRPLADGGILEWGEKAGQSKLERARQFAARTVNPVIVSDIDKTFSAIVSLIGDISKYDTETAIKRNAYKLPLGAIPSQALRRIRPEKQKEEEIKRERGLWVSKILDAKASGDMDRGTKMFLSWNDTYDPQYWISLDDIKGEEIGKRLTNSLWDKLEMMNDDIRRPKK